MPYLRIPLADERFSAYSRVTHRFLSGVPQYCADADPKGNPDEGESVALIIRIILWRAHRWPHSYRAERDIVTSASPVHGQAG
jgi:hypothetical protein